MKKSHYSGKSIFVSKLLIMFIVTIGVYACQKKKQPEVSSPHEMTKTEFFNSVAGHYKVFDTVGQYLYDMNLIHVHNNSTNRDSLKFENFDGEFVFTSEQQVFSNAPDNITIGGGDTLYDTNGKRWKLYDPSFLDYNNFHDDTINLRFEKTNINYYIEDATPYYSCDCKQIAVKQH